MSLLSPIYFNSRTGHRLHGKPPFDVPYIYGGTSVRIRRRRGRLGLHVSGRNPFARRQHLGCCDALYVELQLPWFYIALHRGWLGP
jgi:hypothetical protein